MTGPYGDGEHPLKKIKDLTDRVDFLSNALDTARSDGREATKQLYVHVGHTRKFHAACEALLLLACISLAVD